MSRKRIVRGPGLRGPRGIAGERGLKGERGLSIIGPQGEPGLPGVNAVPADEAVAGYATTEGSATSDALAASFAARELTFAGQQATSEAARLLRSSDDERATPTPDGRSLAVILTGGTEQTYTVSNCTASDDTTRVKAGVQSKRFVTGTGNVTAIATHSPTTAMTHAPASIWRAWVWIDDVTALGGPLQFTHTRLAKIDTVAPPADERWTKSVPVTALHSGWNLISDNTLGMIAATGWGNIHSTRLVWQTTKATGINIGRIWFECPKRASLIFVQDGGYKSFATYAVPELRSRGIPVTWAVNPGWLGQRVGEFNETLTAAEVLAMKAAGDEISFHSYAAGNDGILTANMTREQIRDDSLKSIAAAQAGDWGKGYQFRAAWLQNKAPNHAAAQPYHAAYASPSEKDSHTDSWPPMDRYNIGRVGLHFSTDAFIDDIFNRLEKTRGLCVGYTHGISNISAGDMTPARLTYLLAKIDAAIAAGWLEGTTFTRLVERGGGVLRA